MIKVFNKKTKGVIEVSSNNVVDGKLHISLIRAGWRIMKPLEEAKEEVKEDTAPEDIVAEAKEEVKNIVIPDNSTTRKKKAKPSKEKK